MFCLALQAILEAWINRLRRLQLSSSTSRVSQKKVIILQMLITLMLSATLNQTNKAEVYPVTIKLIAKEQRRDKYLKAYLWKKKHRKSLSKR